MLSECLIITTASEMLTSPLPSISALAITSAPRASRFIAKRSASTASTMFMLPLPPRKVVFPAALNAHRRKGFVRKTGGNANSAAHSVRFRNNNGFRTAEAFALKPEGWLCDRKGGGGRNENAIIAAMNREISLLFSFPNSELLTIRHVVRIKVKPAKAWNSSAYRRPPETPGAVHKEINTEKPQSFIEECCSKGTFAGCSVFRREYTMFILKKS